VAAVIAVILAIAVSALHALSPPETDSHQC
jgi:hypothetical protein